MTADDPLGNVAKIGEHDLTVEEVEHVLNESDGSSTVSSSSGRPVVLGYTNTDRHIAVVIEIDSGGATTDIAVITAYEEPPPSSKRRR